MIIAAFDIAKLTGWAELDTEHDDAFSSGLKIRSGVRDFSVSKHEGDAVRNFTAKRFFLDFAMRADLVYYERIDFKHQSRDAARMYYGFETMLENVCLEGNIRCLSATPADIKREATGKGGGKGLKARMLHLARLQFPEQRIADDNQSDALWLLRYAARKQGVAMGQHVEELPIG